MQAATQRASETINIPREKLASFVTHIFGGTSVGREDDEHPLPPGPWDPIIRKVAKRVFGPQPEPWRLALIRQSEPSAELNVSRVLLRSSPLAILKYSMSSAVRFNRGLPQPLPPRAVSLAAFGKR
jgi:hypothetical protein